jgi:hemoglobin/transferrin/lactoferrin receptor protein
LWQEKVIFTLGGRYDWINIQNDAALNPEFEITDGVRNDNPPGQTVLWPAGDSKNKSWSANLSALYHVHPAFKLKFTTAKSFRSPALEERYQFIDLGNLVKIGDPNLEPEKGAFADVGVEFNFNKFAMSGNVFLNQIDDMVVELPTTYQGRSALKKVNVGQARLSGFDGRIDWEPGYALALYGTVAYVKGEDVKNNTPLPLIPPLNGRLGLRWKGPFHFSLDFSTTMYATQDRIVTDELRTPGYTTYDVFLNSYPITTRFMVSRIVLGVENIANHLYRNHLATNRGLIVAEPGRNLILRWLVDF